MGELRGDELRPATLLGVGTVTCYSPFPFFPLNLALATSSI